MFLEKNRFESHTVRNSLDINLNLPIKILNTETINEKLKTQYKNDEYTANQTSKSNKNIKSNSNNLIEKRSEKSKSPADITCIRHNYLSTQDDLKLKNEKKFIVTLSRAKANEVKVLSTEPQNKDISIVSKIKTSITNKLKIKKIINTDTLVSRLKTKASITPGMQISYKISKNF
jgi:hypothetical protein